MAKVIWSDDSLEDLRQIVSYIADDNPEAAVRVGQRIINFTRLYATSPRIGHVYMNEGGEIRKSVVDGYLVYYSYDETKDLIVIEHVWHGSREDPHFR